MGFQLSRVPRLWRAVIDRRLAPLGLTQTRWITLYHLWRLGRRPTWIATWAVFIGVERLPVQPGPRPDQLAEQGLVERRGCDTDRRTKRIFLTPEATPLLEQIDAVVSQARGEMLAGLDDAEVEQLASLLSRIEENGLAIQACEDVES
ncbi:MAG: transcriptional regulator SlyA [Halomonas sp.]|uniref:transcriptional regulator SlyA n=1 Tax=Halomonas sp. TaxID=1486246 RepID=UPI002ACE097B|nr:transcriptional regulator SlyA [Halomonas sp.]MDZ7853560.1 transcriptional regulator SlyA [Halomonas sp.]